MPGPHRLPHPPLPALALRPHLPPTAEPTRPTTPVLQPPLPRRRAPPAPHVTIPGPGTPTHHAEGGTPHKPLDTHRSVVTAHQPSQGPARTTPAASSSAAAVGSVTAPSTGPSTNQANPAATAHRPAESPNTADSDDHHDNGGGSRTPTARQTLTTTRHLHEDQHTAHDRRSGP
jgi:hypothetical protein